jgi:hypothetical protein
VATDDRAEYGAGHWPSAAIFNDVKAVTTPHAGDAGVLAWSSQSPQGLAASTGVITWAIVRYPRQRPSVGGQRCRTFDLANLTTVNLDASLSGEGVSYLGVG